MRALVAVSVVGHLALRAWWGTYLVQLISPEVRRRQPAAASQPGWRGQRRRQQERGPGLRWAPSAGSRIRPCARAALPPPPCGPSPGTPTSSRRAAPFNFQATSPHSGRLPRPPFPVNAPRSQWARPRRAPSTNNRGAAVPPPPAPPRHVIGCAPRAIGPGSKGWEEGGGSQFHPKPGERAPGGRGTCLLHGFPLQPEGWTPAPGTVPTA